MLIDWIILEAGFNSGLLRIEGILSWIDTTILQKIFYLLSINLLINATVAFLKDKKHHKNKEMFDNITGLEKTAKTVDLAFNPEQKGEEVGRVLLAIKQGGKAMKNYFKSLSCAQIISIIVMILSVIMGIIVGCVPQLAQYEEIIYTIGATFGGASFVGAFARGKSFATVAVNGEISNHKVALKNYTTKLHELEKQYDDVIRLDEDIKVLGGSMTVDQQTRFNTYTRQKESLMNLISREEKSLEEEKLKKKETK